MLYCSSKNLSRKTLASYEQTLKLFTLFLKQSFDIEDVRKCNRGIFGNTLSICGSGASTRSSTRKRARTLIIPITEAIIRRTYRRQP
ncbi:site-specific integrase [Paenibacillus sp. cl123]